MAAAETVHVDLGPRSYDIAIGAGKLTQIAPFVTQRCQTSRAVVITDENVEQSYARAVADALAEEGIDVDVFTVAAGETSKSVDTLNALWHTMLDAGLDRRSLVLAVGGGVIGDLAGFAAASFARGLDFFQVPTTLLAHGKRIRSHE